MSITILLKRYNSVFLRALRKSHLLTHCSVFQHVQPNNRIILYMVQPKYVSHNVKIFITALLSCVLILVLSTLTKVLENSVWTAVLIIHILVLMVLNTAQIIVSLLCTFIIMNQPKLVSLPALTPFFILLTILQKCVCRSVLILFWSL